MICVTAYIYIISGFSHKEKSIKKYSLLNQWWMFFLFKQHQDFRWSLNRFLVVLRFSLNFPF